MKGLICWTSFEMQDVLARCLNNNRCYEVLVVQLSALKSSRCNLIISKNLKISWISNAIQCRLFTFPTGARGEKSQKTQGKEGVELKGAKRFCQEKARTNTSMPKIAKTISRNLQNFGLVFAGQDRLLFLQKHLRTLLDL